MRRQGKTLAKDFKEGTLLSVRIQTGSSRPGLAGISQEYLKVKVCAQPVKGAANKACIALLAKEFRIPKSSITLFDGERSRNKIFLLNGLLAVDVFKILEAKSPYRKWDNK